MSDNTMNIAGEMSAIAASNGIYTLADSALRLSTESLSAAIDNKVTIDNRLCNVIEQSDLSIVKLSASEYYDLVNSDAVVSNVVYVVENQFENAYGQQIKNLAPGTDLSDAVNVEQLNAVSANAGTITGIMMNGVSKGTSGNVDLGTVLTSHQSLADYYKKSETSSASEVSTALDSKADADAYLPLSGGTMSGDVTLGKDNQIVFGSNEDGTIVLQDPSEADFGIHLSTEEDGYNPKYVFNDTYSGFNVEEPTEEGRGIIRSGDLYAALSDYYTKSETSSTSEIANALSDIKIGYDSDARKIVLSAGSSTTSVDCNDFIKDGMLSTVELHEKQLIFNFNTDAGMQPISIALSNFIDETQYWKKTETSSAAEISAAFQLSAGNKVFIDNHIDNATEQTDLSVIKLLADEYYQLVAESAIISNVIYVVENQFKNAYGQQIKNLAPGTDLSDAVNFEQLSAVSSSVPTKVSQLANDAGYTANTGTITGITMNGVSKGVSGDVNLGTVLTAHQSLSDYYTKSETSSAAEISAALESIEPPDPVFLSNTTYTELKAARDADQLVPGTQYRITDYETKCNGIAPADQLNNGTPVLENGMASTAADVGLTSLPFDVIVTATSVSALSETAHAIIRDGHAYETAPDFEAWKLNYCLDNDLDRFSWASDDGKGVVYRLVDEFGNDCPYDFKNIVFMEKSTESSPDDLIHRWSFNNSLEDTGSIGGMTAKLGGNASFVNGSSVRVNAGSNNSSYVELGANPIPSSLGDTPFTIEVWATPTEIMNYASVFALGERSNYNAAGLMGVFQGYRQIREGGETESGPVWQAVAGNLIKNDGTSAGTGQNVAMTYGVISANTPYYFAYVVTPNGDGNSATVIGYVYNASTGELVGKSSVYTVTNWTTAVLSQLWFGLGTTPWDDAAPGAEYDEVRVWKKALSPYEIKSHVASGADSVPGEMRFTFSSATENGCCDGSLAGAASSNVIGAFINRGTQHLNRIVFLGISLASAPATNNTFSDNCSSIFIAGGSTLANSFGAYSACVSLGSSCQNNTFGTFTSNCSFGNNTLQCRIGPKCSNIACGNSCRVSFGANVQNVSLGDYCQWFSLGDNCQRVSAGSYCVNVILGNGCQDVIFGEEAAVQSYFRGVVLAARTCSVSIRYGGSSDRDSNYVQYIDVSGFSNENPVDIVVEDFSQSYRTSFVPGTNAGSVVKLTYPTESGKLALDKFDSYYTKSETSSATEISTAFQLSAGNKVFVDSHIDNVVEQTDLSVIKLSSDEYGQILDDVLSNAIYIVEDSYNNAYGAQIKNLAPGTDLSDAVNLEQLNNVLSGHTYDLNTDGELTKMVVDLVRAFGGTVLNSPS